MIIPTGKNIRKNITLRIIRVLTHPSASAKRRGLVVAARALRILAGDVALELIGHSVGFVQVPPEHVDPGDAIAADDRDVPAGEERGLACASSVHTPASLK